MTDHPLANLKFNIKNFKCFDEEGSGQFHFAAKTVIIGRNNSGKTSVLNFLEGLIGHGIGKFDFKRTHLKRLPSLEFEMSRSFNPLEFQATFPDHVLDRMSSLGHDINALRSFILENDVDFVIGHNEDISLSVQQANGSGLPCYPSEEFDVKKAIISLFRNSTLKKIQTTSLIPISANKELSQEPHSRTLNIERDGQGVVNDIRDCVINAEKDRTIIDVNLLNDLNNIYDGSAHFTRIHPKEVSNGHYEIFLSEHGKPDVALSQSGSGIHKIIILLTYFHALPKEMEKKLSNSVFFVEEPENNLHPALLRRLLEYLHRKQQEHQFSLVITTHSPVCIDWAVGLDDSTVIHVKRQDGRTTCQNVLDAAGRRSVLDDLDVRGSDILQANAIIWVEGPSDRIYINHWVSSFDPRLKEGLHYTIMFYGGALIAHLTSDDEALTEFINLRKINRYFAIVLDSDKSKQATPLKQHVERFVAEQKDGSPLVWVTEGREIENYIDGTKLQTALAIVHPKIYHSASSTGKFDNSFHFFRKKEDGNMDDEVYKDADKVALARKICEEDPDFTVNRLGEKVREIVNMIRRANGLAPKP